MVRNRLIFNFTSIKPLTANQAWRNTKGGRSYLSPEYRMFKEDIANQLAVKRYEIFQFDNFFSPYEHCLETNIYVGLPKDMVFCKDGRMKKKNDADNFIKPLIDSSFVFFDKIDDAFNASVTCCKYWNKEEKYSIIVDIQILDMDAVIEMPPCVPKLK